MSDITLEANRRSLLGKRVRVLRREGILPAHLYGPHISPVPLQLDARSFRQAWTKAGSVTLIDLSVDGKKPSAVLIREVQTDATTGRLLHADLYAVAMSERLRVSVPLVFIGEAPATRQGGVLLRSLDSVEVESLPGDLPHQIEVDISNLTEFDSGIHVRDLMPPPRVTILSHSEELVAKVAAPALAPEEVAPPAVPAPEAELPGVTREAEAGA